MANMVIEAHFGLCSQINTRRLLLRILVPQKWRLVAECSMHLASLLSHDAGHFLSHCCVQQAPVPNPIQPCEEPAAGRSRPLSNEHLKSIVRSIAGNQFIRH